MFTTALIGTCKENSGETSRDLFVSCLCVVVVVVSCLVSRDFTDELRSASSNNVLIMDCARVCIASAVSGDLLK